MRLLSILLLLGPSVALAQVRLSVTANSTQSITFAPSRCGGSESITWTVSGIASACGSLKVWATTGSCGEAPNTTAGDKTLESISAATALTQGSGTVVVKFDELPFFSNSTTDGGSSACGEEGVELGGALCASIGTRNGLGECSEALEATEEITVAYDAKPPGKPNITSVGPLDGRLSVGVSNVESGATVRLEYRTLNGGGKFELGGTIASGQTSGTISNLTNGTTYEVRALAIDPAENVSEPSDTAQGTPEYAQGFFAAYKEAGGAEQGGCSAAGAGLLAPLALLAFVALRRKQ